MTICVNPFITVVMKLLTVWSHFEMSLILLLFKKICAENLF